MEGREYWAKTWTGRILQVLRAMQSFIVWLAISLTTRSPPEASQAQVREQEALDQGSLVNRPAARRRTKQQGVIECLAQCHCSHGVATKVGHSDYIASDLIAL